MPYEAFSSATIVCNAGDVKPPWKAIEESIPVYRILAMMIIAAVGECANSPFADRFMPEPRFLETEAHGRF